MGAVPVQDAKRLRSAKRATSPTSARMRAATTGPTPGRSIRLEPRSLTMALISTVRALDLLLDRDQVGQLVRGDAAAGLPGEVARTDAGEDRLGLQGGDVLLRLARGELGEQSLQPVDGLRPADSTAGRGGRRASSAPRAGRRARGRAGPWRGRRRPRPSARRGRRSCGRGRCRGAVARAASLAGTSTTRSPASNRRCASGRPTPRLPSTAHSRCGHGLRRTSAWPRSRPCRW